MMQSAQASEFYRSLSEEEKSLLVEAIAEDVYFIDDIVCEKLMCTLHEVEPELAERIRTINGFTRR